MKTDVKGRTGCGRCTECKHHALNGKQYVCLNMESFAREWLKNKTDTETLLPDRFAYEFHNCCEVKDD